MAISYDFSYKYRSSTKIIITSDRHVGSTFYFYIQLYYGAVCSFLLSICTAPILPTRCDKSLQPEIQSHLSVTREVQWQITCKHPAMFHRAVFSLLSELQTEDFHAATHLRDAAVFNNSVAVAPVLWRVLSGNWWKWACFFFFLLWLSKVIVLLPTRKIKTVYIKWQLLTIYHKSWRKFSKTKLDKI